MSKKLLSTLLSICCIIGTIQLTVFSENDEIIIKGVTTEKDYTYIDGVLNIVNPGNYVVSNKNKSVTQDSIVISTSTSDTTVTFDGLNIDTSMLDRPAFDIIGNGNVKIILEEKTCNKLISGKNCAGLQKTNKNSKLEISGKGELIATGGDFGAGIGGGKENSGDNIIIQDGTIIATGGIYGAGIGAGSKSGCKNIIILNGIIEAIGGYEGNGIGGCEKGQAKNIVITGGSIKSSGKKPFSDQPELQNYINPKILIGSPNGKDSVDRPYVIISSKRKVL